MYSTRHVFPTRMRETRWITGKDRVMTHDWLVTLLTEFCYFDGLEVWLCTDRTQSTCETGDCGRSHNLATSVAIGNFTPALCEELKTYVYCLSVELDGCVGESSDRNSLQILADIHYAIIASKCDFGANGICDIADCVFVANVTNGYSTQACSQIKTYISCLQTEESECGSGTIYGILVTSELDSHQLYDKVHCGSSRNNIFYLMPLIASRLAMYTANLI